MTTILLGKECSPFLEIDHSLLQRADTRLVWAESSDAFVPLVRDSRPDVVLLDPHVPGFDAFATARAIHADDIGARALLFVIGNAADHDRALAAGVTGLVTRPATQARLLELLRRHGLVRERGDDRLEIALKVAVTQRGEEGLAYTRDLSSGGCFLHAQGKFLAGDAVRLSFHLPVPGGRDIATDADVVRVEIAPHPGAGSGGIAVRFAGRSGADRAELGQFLRSRRPGVS